MITLQKLLNLAKRHNLNPSEVTIVLRQICGDGSYQLDFLVDPRIEKDVQCLDLEDNFIPVPNALTLEILMPIEDDDGSDNDLSPGPFDSIIQNLKDNPIIGAVNLEPDHET